MPRTLSFPPPSATTCPICAVALSGPRCDGCGATFTGPDGDTLWRVDHDLYDLCLIRNDLVRRLLLPEAPAEARATPGRDVPDEGRPDVPLTGTVPGKAGPVPAPATVAPGAPGQIRPGAATAAPAAVPAEGRPTPAPAAARAPATARRAAAPTPGETGARSAEEARSTATPGVPPHGPGSGCARDQIPAQNVWDPWPGAAAVAEGWRPGPVGGPGQAPPPRPPAPPVEPPAHRPRPALSAAEVLVGLGALSLVAAVAVFAAVRWSDLAAWAQGALVVGLTGLVATVAAACRRRHLTATAESLGAVTVALGLADVQVARVALDGVAPDRIVTAAGLAAIASAGLALGRRTGIRSLVLAGTALALTPLVVAASASTRPTVWLAALAAQAVVAGLVAARAVDRPLERTVIAVGAAVSWAGTIAAALGLATAGLAADPIAHPSGPAAVLALLAVGTIVAARRIDEGPITAVVGGAGAALAFVPGLMMATSVGSPVGVVAVLAVQAIVGLAAAELRGAAVAEATVARCGGAVSWVAALVGGLALATAELADGTTPTSAALVLVGLAAATIVLARARPEAPTTAALSTAGTALAFVPGVLVALGAGDPVALVAVLAGQAAVALAAVVSPLPTVAERAATVVAGASSWVGAVTIGVTAGLIALVDGDAATDPTVTALVLAALAVVSIGAGRVRGAERPGVPIDLVSGGGVGLALVPGLLVAATTTPTTLLAVVAAQAVVALGATGLRRGRGDELVLLPAERAMATGGGWLLWATAAAGSLALVGHEIAFGVVEDRIGGLAIAAALAVASLLVGVVARRSDLTAAGVALAFVPVPLGLVDLAVPALLILVVGAEALVAALLAPAVRDEAARAVLRTGGVIAWIGALGGATLLGATADDPTSAVALLAGLAALAVGAALLSGWDRAVAGIGLGAAVAPILLAVALAAVASGLGAAGCLTAVLGATAVLALGLALLGRRDPVRPWSAPAQVALAVGAVAAIVPVWSVIAVVVALVERAAGAPAVGADVVLSDWLRRSEVGASLALPGWATVGQIAALAALVAAVGLQHRRAGRALGAVVAVGALAVVPVAAGLTIAVTTAGFGVVVILAGLAARRRSEDPELLLGSMAAIALGTAVAVGSAPWAVAWTLLVTLVVGALAVGSVVDRSPDASTWVGAAVVTLLGGVALDGWVLGATGIGTLLAIAIAAAAVTPLAALLERRDELGAADLIDALATVALAVTVFAALTVTGDIFSTAPFVAVVGVAAAGAALRPRRRPLWLVATGSGVVLAWLQASRSEIDAIEAYTLPLAAWAVLVGVVAGRGRGSWERFGIGLLTAAGPTTVLALVDPDPVRTVAVVAIGAATAIWGAAARLQAPLAVGAGAVAIVALRHLGPVGIEMPRYVAFAVAGLVLLAVGATFEQRRHDLRQAREAFTRLG